MTGDGKAADRRRASRRRVLKGARIIFRDGYSVINCIVRDQSEVGARLKVDTVVGIPDTFRLQIMQAPPRDCRVVWKTGSEIGVEFVARLEAK